MRMPIVIFHHLATHITIATTYYKVLEKSVSFTKLLAALRFFVYYVLKLSEEDRKCYWAYLFNHAKSANTIYIAQ